MAEDTKNPNVVTEKEKEEDARLDELSKKTDRNEEETKEFNTLKDNRQTRYQKRIDQLTWRAKDAEERYGEADERAKQLEAELAEAKQSRPTDKPVVTEETVTYGNKKFYTDATLQSMIESGQITEAKAYQHQRARDKAEILNDIKAELQQTNKQTEEQRIRIEDAQKVLREYPNLSRKLPDGSANPNFNPEDPLTKTVHELWNEGYAANPKGFSKAIQRAKQILKISDKPIDASDDFRVHSSSSAPEKPAKTKEIPFSKEEEETAITMFCRGDTKNPTTNRPYTEAEAIAKAKKAKADRLGSRRIT